MSIDKSTVIKVAADIDVALAEVGKKYGMLIKTSNGKYDPVEGSFRTTITALKVDVSEIGDPRLAGTKPKDIANAKSLGYFGKTVDYFGKSYEIVGHNGYVLLGWDPRTKRSVRFNQAQTAQVMPQLRGAPAATPPVAAPAAPARKTTGTSNLAQFINERKAHNRIFGGRDYDVNNLSASDMKELADQLGCELSPENLSCDGEAPAHHVRVRGDFLRKAAAELVSIGGPVAQY